MCRHEREKKSVAITRAPNEQKGKALTFAHTHTQCVVSLCLGSDSVQLLLLLLLLLLLFTLKKPGAPVLLLLLLLLLHRSELQRFAA